MNVLQLKDKIYEAVIKIPLVHDVTYGDVYDNWNNREMKYMAVNYVIEQGYVQNDTVQYSVYFAVADRLEQDENNLVRIQTDCQNALRIILNQLEEDMYGLSNDDYTAQFFTQKFADYLGGVIATVYINVPYTDDCAWVEGESDEDINKQIREKINQINGTNQGVSILDKLDVTDSLRQQLAQNINYKGVPTTEDEGLSTLVPKVLEIEGGGSPVIEPLSVTPTTGSQSFTPGPGIDGYSPVTIEAVDNSIDNNIQPQNILQGVNILGVDGTVRPYVAPVLDTLNVTPSISAQTITPSGGTDGFDEVTVDAVTAAIDANITPGNIKKDVAILGVTGTMEPMPEGDEVGFGGLDNVTDITFKGRQVFVSSTNAKNAAELRDYFPLNVSASNKCPRYVYFPELTTITPTNYFQSSGIRIIKLPNVTSLTSFAFRANNAIYIEVGRLISGPLTQGSNDVLRMFVVGAGTAVNINLGAYWTATNVIAEGQSGIDELNANIVYGLADKVADRTGQTALTITFGASLYNVLTAETIAAFTVKNWNVASA